MIPRAYIGWMVDKSWRECHPGKRMPHRTRAYLIEHAERMIADFRRVVTEAAAS